MYVSIGIASDYLGVAISTLRRWHSNGTFLPAFLTIGGHRRYAVSDLKKLAQVKTVAQEKKTVLYARTSGHDQKEDLERQIARLEAYALEQNYAAPVVLKVKGSGLNYSASGLKKLIRMIIFEQVERVILVSKDRLLRFGAEILFFVCKLKGIEIIVLDAEMKESFEQELAFDLILILTVFTSKLYGKRSHKNRKKIAELSQREACSPLQEAA